MTGPCVRTAHPEEAAEIAALLRRSITELCAADHGNRPEILAAWLENKTPEAVRGWLADPGQRLIVAELDGRLAGVAAARADGSILLNYVSPDFTRRGIGSTLLAELEAWACAQKRDRNPKARRPPAPFTGPAATARAAGPRTTAAPAASQ